MSQNGDHDGSARDLWPLALGLTGLLGFLWSLKSGQYDNLDGAAWRAIADG
jgi:cbb3-type cytochrome oxidase maturation protein